MFWTTFHVKRVCEVIHSNWRLTVQEVANEVGISKMCHKILTENLGTQPVAAKYATHLPNDEQTQGGLEVSQGLFDHANNDKNFLKTSWQVMTHGFSVMMPKQKPSLHDGSQKRHPDPNKHGKFSQMWKWCWLFLCFEGAVHQEFLPHGQTVEKEYYLEIIKCLWEAGKKRACFLKGKKNGHSTTTLLHIPHCLFMTFLQSLRPLPSHYHRNCQISHQQTSFCSWSWNSHWKVDVLSLLITSKKIHWRSCVLFHKKHSRNASKTGKNAGSSVWEWRKHFEGDKAE